MESNVIQLENLTKTYFMGDTQVNALRGVTYTIKEGDFVAIMGPSGSGKSTLMNIIGCLDKPTSGRYLLDGEDVSKYDKNRLAVTRNKKPSVRSARSKLSVGPSSGTASPCCSRLSR